MLKPGTELMIEIKNQQKVIKCRSKIADLNNGSILIYYPVDSVTNKTLYVKTGSRLNISFTGDQDQPYQFTAVVTGQRKKLKVPLLIITKPEKEEIKRIQRRDFVRVNWTVDVAVHPLHGEFKPFVTVTDDISAGGASILVPKNLPLYPGQQLICWFVLLRKTGKYNYLKLRCEIIRISGMNVKRNLMSVKFLDKSAKDEQNLLQFCYETQVALRRKETKI